MAIAFFTGCFRNLMIRVAPMGFTNKTTNNNIIINGHDDFKVEKSKSIPTDTKNKTANMSLIGRASEVALALKSD